MYRRLRIDYRPAGWHWRRSWRMPRPISTRANRQRRFLRAIARFVTKRHEGWRMAETASRSAASSGQHYTSSREQAAALAAYVLGAGGNDARNCGARSRAKARRRSTRGRPRRSRGSPSARPVNRRSRKRRRRRAPNRSDRRKTRANPRRKPVPVAEPGSWPAAGRGTRRPHDRDRAVVAKNRKLHHRTSRAAVVAAPSAPETS